MHALSGAALDAAAAPPRRFLAGKSMRECVFRSIYTTRNAELQLRAMAIGTLGPLSAGEAEKCGGHNLGARGVERAWEYWVTRLQKAEAMRAAAGLPQMKGLAAVARPQTAGLPQAKSPAKKAAPKTPGAARGSQKQTGAKKKRLVRRSAVFVGMESVEQQLGLLPSPLWGSLRNWLAVTGFRVAAVGEGDGAVSEGWVAYFWLWRSCKAQPSPHPASFSPRVML